MSDLDPAGNDDRFGMERWYEGETFHARSHLAPEACIPGTERPYTGVLFAMADVVVGTPPTGPMNPTVDLRVELWSPPRRPSVRFAGRTLRIGQTLYVGEALIYNGDDDVPFALAMATFMNRPIDPRFGGPGLGFVALTGVRRAAAGVLEIDADLRGPRGTVAGATLGRLVELAAMDVAGEAYGVDSLDVRFLNRVKAGPLRATAEILGWRGHSASIRVDVSDVGSENKLVSYGLAVCRPL